MICGKTVCITACRLRTAVGWSQDEVARNASFWGLAWTRSVVAGVETGRRELSRFELFLVPHALPGHVAPADLLTADPSTRVSLPDGGWIEVVNLVPLMLGQGRPGELTSAPWERMVGEHVQVTRHLPFTGEPAGFRPR
jgi:hypothetical protein